MLQLGSRQLGDIRRDPPASRLTAIVTSDLVAHKGQTPCKRYCKLGRQTPYSRHRYPHKTLEIA
jgi:hypothetical protein